jgi:hypothetical protein
MRNILEVLREKEAELATVRLQIQCLRVVVPLLAEEADRGGAIHVNASPAEAEAAPTNQFP